MSSFRLVKMKCMINSRNLGDHSHILNLIIPIIGIALCLEALADHLKLFEVSTSLHNALLGLERGGLAEYIHFKTGDFPCQRPLCDL
jgi:hypothetical protein